MSDRRTTINVVEVRGETRATINTDGAVNFTLTFQPVKFPDAKIAELVTIVENQRDEITAEMKAHAQTRTALAEAKKAKRRR
jgi:hypothetical protein